MELAECQPPLAPITRPIFDSTYLEILLYSLVKVGVLEYFVSVSHLDGVSILVCHRGIQHHSYQVRLPYSLLAISG
jgi:hypothetical protein